MGRNYSATAVDTTLSSAITSTATTVVVAGTVGLPTPPFVIAVIDSPGSQEVMLVTAVGGNTLTVSRAYDGTTATAHPSGALVRHVASAVDFREAQQHIDATTGVHGVGAGAVVGTTTVQTLTNKNFTSGTNTFPAFITGYLVPTGAGMEWPSTAPAPAGYLMQDGGEYLISANTALYNFLTSNGTVFPHGANTNGSGGAGSTHFRTPNRKGRVAVGYNASDTDFNAIGKTGGAKTHTLSASEMPVHTHVIDGVAAHGHAHEDYWYNTMPSNGFRDSTGAGSSPTVIAITEVIASAVRASDLSGAHTHTAQNAGGGAAHNNMQPFIVMNYIIKT